MHIKLSEIEAFSAVYENRSFKGAAEALAISAPALTRRIQKLEDMLGVQLVRRTTRSVEITSTGREFYRRTRSVLDDLETSILSFQDASQQRSRVVSVACITSATQYFLPDVLAAFNAQNSRVKVRILDVSAVDCVDAVQSGEVDFGVTFSGLGEPGLHFLPLKQDPFVLVCSRQHPLATRQSVPWKELAQHRYIAAYKGSGNRMLVDARLAEEGFQVPWFYEVRHFATSLSLAERELGVAAMPRSALPSGEHPTLAVVPLVDPLIHRTVGVIFRESGEFSSPTQALFDMLVSRWGVSAGAVPAKADVAL